MKILLVNLSDSKGGAAVIAYRLLNALNAKEGVQAKMLVAEKSTDDENVIALPKSWWLKKVLDRMVVWASNHFSKQNLWLTDGGFLGNDITQRKEFKEADVIHLHWVNQGFLGLSDIEKILNSGKKVVWTLHDLWPIVGACHLPYDCVKYKTAKNSNEKKPDKTNCQGCHSCQYLKCDFSQRVFKKKRAMYEKAENLHFVAVSKWVNECFFSSALMKDTGIQCSVISNLMPIEQFQFNRKPRLSDEIVLAMGAARLDDPVKGFSLLVEALKKCAENAEYKNRLRLILYGNIKDEYLLNQLPIPYTYKGVLTQTEVAETFRESDVVLSCSAYETFGATLAEGIASGCLAVTRGTGGQRGVVEHEKTGYIVEEGEDFANGILWAASKIDEQISQKKENYFREQQHLEMLRRFSYDVVAEQYLEAYNN